MMVRDDYYEIALDILDFLEDNLASKHYNVLGSMAEQIAENMLIAKIKELRKKGILK